MKEVTIQQYVATEAHRAGYLFHADTIGLLRSKRTGGLAKVTGSRKGWPDMVFLLEGGITVYIELKGPKTAVSPEQKEIHAWMKSLGHRVHLVRAQSGIDAWQKIKAILEDRDGK